MSSAAIQKALKAAGSGGFAPAYYLHGEDDFLKEDAARRLVALAVDPATRDFNYEQRRGADLDGETLGSLLGTPPMMAERRMLVVRDPAGLKKDARKALDRYLASPASDLVLLLVAPAGAKADKALADRTTALEFTPLSGDRLPKWIAHHAEEAHGAQVTPEAASLLQSAVGSDLPLLALEIDKCASYAGGAPIDEAVVSAVVGVRREETLGALLDAAGARDTREALRLLPRVLEQPKVTAVTTVMALSAQIFGIGWVQAQRARGANAGQIAREGFSVLKEGGGFVGRPWGEAVQSWTRYADKWTAADVDRALAALLAADRALKSTRVSADEQLLGTLLLELTAPAR